MAKNYMTNELLSKAYMKEIKIFSYGPRQKAIIKSIRECPTIFYEHYVKNNGNLKGLYFKKDCRGISLKTLDLLREIIEKRVGKVESAETETVKNKSKGFMLRVRPYTFGQ